MDAAENEQCGARYGRRQVAVRHAGAGYVLGTLLNPYLSTRNKGEREGREGAGLGGRGTGRGDFSTCYFITRTRTRITNIPSTYGGRCYDVKLPKLKKLGTVGALALSPPLDHLYGPRRRII